jgi:hypothetical protein
MADGISAVFRGVSEMQAEFARIDKSVDRATMYTIRQAGRKVRQYAAKQAPVYTGPPRNWYYGGQVGGPIIKGELKKSVKSDKRLGRIAGGYSLKVRPRGTHPRLYAGQQEARKPFMAPALSAVSGEIGAIAESAWGRAYRTAK